MTQRTDLEKVAQVALDYALTKAAGIYSEMIGNANPLNLYGGSIGGGIAALTNPTRTDEEQAKADKSILSNLLIPGVAPYNSFKRLGYSARNQHLLKAKDDLAYAEWKQRHQHENRFKREQSESQDKEEKAQTKAANALDYALTKSALNPTPQVAPSTFDWRHALLGAGLGAGAGALSGLFAPGKDDDDETDRTGSAVMRGLLGGALGGAAGGFGGKYVAPYLPTSLVGPQQGRTTSMPDARFSNVGMQNARYPQNKATATGMSPETRGARDFQRLQTKLQNAF